MPNEHLPSDGIDGTAVEVESRLRPDAYQSFRMAQLLLVIVQATDRGDYLDTERLSIVEFLAANPFLIVQADDDAALSLRLAGFSSTSLSYASPGQRFATRRERLYVDLQRLGALGFVRFEVRDGRRVLRATTAAKVAGGRLTSTYADALRASIPIILRLVMRMTDGGIQKRLGDWLRVSPYFYDLLGMESDQMQIGSDYLLSPGEASQ
jgi:hypothetical protein